MSHRCVHVSHSRLYGTAECICMTHSRLGGHDTRRCVCHAFWLKLYMGERDTDTQESDMNMNVCI